MARKRPPVGETDAAPSKKTKTATHSVTDLQSGTLQDTQQEVQHDNDHQITPDPRIQASRQTSFMDLPPEIRIKVYRMLLIEEDGLDLRRFKPITYWLRGLVPLRRDGEQPYNINAILCVSKNIMSEAGPVAYGENILRIDAWTPATEFLDEIGSMRRYIRHLSISTRCRQPSMARAALHKLKDAKLLRSISLSYDGEYVYDPRIDHDSLRKFATALKPLLKTLRKAQMTAGAPGSILDLVKWGPLPHCDECRAGKECKYQVYQPRRTCVNVTNQQGLLAPFLRARLAETLKIEE